VPATFDHAAIDCWMAQLHLLVGDIILLIVEVMLLIMKEECN